MCIYVPIYVWRTPCWINCEFLGIHDWSPTLLHLWDNMVVLMQCIRYPPFKCWLLHNRFASAYSECSTKLDTFKSFNFSWLVNPSFHIMSSLHPFIIIFGFTFPFAEVIVLSKMSIAVASFLWSKISSKSWNILPSLSTSAYVLSAHHRSALFR